MAPAVHNVTHGTNPHVVAMPRYSTHIGIARLILSVVVLTLVATAAGLWSSAHHAAFGLTLFTASATLLIKLYYTLSLTRLPHLYHPYAILACEALGTVFWLTSFALCAEWTAAFNHHWWTGGSKTATNYGFWNAPFRPEDMGLVSREVTGTAAGGAGGGNGGRWKAAVGCMGATAGLSGVLFVLFAVTLVVFSMNLHRHRKAGMPMVYGGAMGQAAAGNNTAAPAVEVIAAEGEEKDEGGAGRKMEQTSVLTGRAG